MSDAERFAPPISSATAEVRGPTGARHAPVESGAGAQKATRGFVMRKLYEAVVRFIEREDGPTAVEYAVMLALIIVVCLGAITVLGQNANSTFNNVALNTAVTTSAS